MSFEQMPIPNEGQEEAISIPKKSGKFGKLKSALAATLVAGAALTEGCKPEVGDSVIPPESGHKITERVNEKVKKTDYVKAEDVIAMEKAADSTLWGYLENLSNNSSSGDRLEKSQGGDIFLEMHGWFFQLTKSDLLRLRSIVMQSAMSPNSSREVRSELAQALKIKIDLDISAHAKKVTDSSILPEKIGARYNELGKMGLIKADNQNRGGAETNKNSQKGGVKQGPDFDKGADF